MSLRHSWLLVVILVVLGNLAGWWALNQPVDPKPWGQMINGVSFSADGSLNRYGAITGRYDYATQTIILDPVRLAGE